MKLPLSLQGKVGQSQLVSKDASFGVCVCGRSRMEGVTTSSSMRMCKEDEWSPEIESGDVMLTLAAPRRDRER